MQQERTVEIYVAGDSSDSGHYGTGYLVSPNLVLTAKHALLKNTTMPPASPYCEIRVFGDVLKKNLQWRKGTIAWPPADEWDDHSECDIALVSFPEDDATTNYSKSRLSFGWPKQYLVYDCTALGFPRGRVYSQNKREIWPIRGMVDINAGSREERYYIALGSNDSPEIARRSFDEVDSWCGFSGAALFCGPIVVGVVIRNPDKHSLVANRIEQALGSKSFSRMLGVPDQRPKAPSISDDQYELGKLVCLVDRFEQEAEFQSKFAPIVLATQLAPVVCLVEGSQHHAHAELARRFAFKTLPRITKNRDFAIVIRPINWPTRLDSIEDGMRRLQLQMQLALGFASEEMHAVGVKLTTGISNEQLCVWRRKLDAVETPWIFYSELRVKFFNKKHEQLLDEWVRFLANISKSGLTHPCVHLIAVVWEESEDSVQTIWSSWPWRRRIRATKLWLKNQPKRPSDLVRIMLPELEPCTWSNVVEWLDNDVRYHRPDLNSSRGKLEASLYAALGTGDDFTLSELRTQIHELVRRNEL
jgi:hypothetical protein